MMEVVGNIFTHYNYTTTDIEMSTVSNTVEIKSKKSDFLIEIEKADNASLPVNSPFADWKEARRFAGPLPFTFTYNPEAKNVLIVEGVRQNWQPAAVKNCELANAFIIENVPYYWKKGKIEKWNN
jgi:hypothetical protein